MKSTLILAGALAAALVITGCRSIANDGATQRAFLWSSTTVIEPQKDGTVRTTKTEAPALETVTALGNVATSIVTGSIIPAIVVGIKDGSIAIGKSVADLVRTPATVIDNVTTVPAVQAEATPAPARNR